MPVGKIQTGSPTTMHIYLSIKMILQDVHKVDQSTIELSQVNFRHALSDKSNEPKTCSIADLSARLKYNIYTTLQYLVSQVEHWTRTIGLENASIFISHSA
jgi:hypothetical protein